MTPHSGRHHFWISFGIIPGISWTTFELIVPSCATKHLCTCVSIDIFHFFGQTERGVPWMIPGGQVLDYYISPCCSLFLAGKLHVLYIYRS